MNRPLISRRVFNASGTLTAALLANAARAGTGESLTLPGMGGAHIGRMEDADAQACIELVLEMGIRFFDTAHVYSKGNAETLYGKFLSPKYRDEAFLMTKSAADTAENFIEQFGSGFKPDGLMTKEIWGDI